jgi:hypothetical protein
VDELRALPPLLFDQRPTLIADGNGRRGLSRRKAKQRPAQWPTGSRCLTSSAGIKLHSLPQNLCTVGRSPFLRQVGGSHAMPKKYELQQLRDEVERLRAADDRTVDLLRRVHTLLSESKSEEASQAVVEELLKRGFFVG